MNPAAVLVLAHGDVVPQPGPGDVVGAWAFEPFVWAGVALALWLYRRGAGRVRGWPSRRSWCAYAGLTVLLVALGGPPAVYAGSVFWAHMVQHLLLTLVAAPLLVFAAPATLLLRAAGTRGSGAALRVVRSRPVRALSHPGVGWAAFAVVMWASHYSSLYDRALESGGLHVVEHLLYLGAALLFWTPVAGVEPVRRLSRPLRLVYLLAALPVQSFLGLALYSADEPRYPHYATLGRTWGPATLDDQRVGAMAMWIGGDVLLLTWAGVVAVGWMRAEERAGARVDRRLGGSAVREDG